MFKNMKLSAKLFFGFGTLVIITAILGIIGWRGMNTVNAIVAVNEEGKAAVDTLNQCAGLRRDFAIRGFTAAPNETKNAAEKWQEAYDTLVSQLKELNTNDRLDAQQKSYVADTLRQTEDYLAAFEQGAGAQKKKDEATGIWGKVGWDITSNLDEAQEKVLLPEINKAFTQNDTAGAGRWTEWSRSLTDNVIKNFLLLRVNAVYLIAKETDDKWEAYQKQLQVLQAGLDEWTRLTAEDTRLQGYAGKLADSVKQYAQAGDTFHQAILDQHSGNAKMASVASTIVNSMEELGTDLQNTLTSTSYMVNTTLIIASISSILIGTVLAFVITRSIVKPVHKIIADLTDGAEQVASASGQVSAASQSLAEGATEQAAGLQETSSSLEEMSSMTKQNADNAQQANTLAAQARNAANEGASSMQRMSGAINDIQKSSDETSKIIKVIDEIAFQTNLLALNAAVEAARAGEAGKGFAVVAEEVRNLAMRSAEAAKNTSNLIEESVKNAKNGVEISVEVSKQLEEIVTNVGKTTDLVGEIAAASQEQAQGIEQVNTAVSQMDKVTQQNAANAEESASASEELSAQAEQMHNIVQELAALVDGTSALNRQTAAAPARAAKKKPAGKLSLTDQTFHHIANKGAKKDSGSERRDPAKVIPLNDEFKEFNG